MTTLKRIFFVILILLTFPLALILFYWKLANTSADIALEEFISL